MDSFAFSTITSAIGLVIPCLILFGCIWVLWRTQSRHVLKYRLWRMVHGSQEISDPEVCAYVNEQTSLMSFRFMSGIPVKTLENARQLIQWAKFHDVEMSEVAMCGNYFDPDLRKIRLDKLPSSRLQKANATLTALIFLVSLVCLFFASLDDALIRLRATDHWLLLRDGQAKVLFPISANPLRKTECSANANTNASRTNFSAEEVEVLCGLLNSDGTTEYANATIKQQRFSFALLSASLLFWDWISFLAWRKGFIALRLSRSSLASDLAGQQLELNFNPTAPSYQ